MAITSRIESVHPQGVRFDQRDLTEGVLPRMSVIRTDKMYSLHQKILVHRFGRMTEMKYHAAIALLHDLVKS